MVYPTLNPSPPAGRDLSLLPLSPLAGKGGGGIGVNQAEPRTYFRPDILATLLTARQLTGARARPPGLPAPSE